MLLTSNKVKLNRRWRWVIPCHDMETLSAWLSLCEENPPVSFPPNWPEVRSFDVFFAAGVNKLLTKLWSCLWFEAPWTSYKICEIVGCACAGNPGTFSPPPQVSDPDMHHGTCLTHVPRCMLGSLSSGFLRSRWQGKRSRHSRRMHNQLFCVSGKRSMAFISHFCNWSYFFIFHI